MKKLLLFLTMLLCVSSGYSQKWNGIKSDSPTTIQTSLVSSSENEIVVDVKVDGYYSTSVRTPKGKQLVITGDDMAPMLVAGAPNLPMSPVSMIIGDNAAMKVSILESEYTDIEGVEVAPSKGNIKRQLDPEEVEYVYGDIYIKKMHFIRQSLHHWKNHTYIATIADRILWCILMLITL